MMIILAAISLIYGCTFEQEGVEWKGRRQELLDQAVGRHDN